MILSIIVPVYNVSKYIDDCLVSICNNISNTNANNIEVIIIDDGSTDDSANKIKKYTNKKNIFYYYKVNGGLSDARNYGLELAKGDYVFFIDSDDIISSDALSSIETELLKYKYDIVSFDVFRFNDSTGKKRRINCNVSHKEDYYNKPYYACNKVFRRSILNKYQPLFPYGAKFEDIATIPLLINELKTFKHIGKSIYGYRIRNGAITTTLNDGSESIINALLTLKKRANFSPFVIQCFIKESFGVLLNILRVDSFEKYDSNLKKAYKEYNKVVFLKKIIVGNYPLRSKISALILKSRYSKIICFPLYVMFRWFL